MQGFKCQLLFKLAEELSSNRLGGLPSPPNTSKSTEGWHCFLLGDGILLLILDTRE